MKRQQGGVEGGAVGKGESTMLDRPTAVKAKLVLEHNLHGKGDEWGGMRECRACRGRAELGIEKVNGACRHSSCTGATVVLLLLPSASTGNQAVEPALLQRGNTIAPAVAPFPTLVQYPCTAQAPVPVCAPLQVHHSLPSTQTPTSGGWRGHPLVPLHQPPSPLTPSPNNSTPTSLPPDPITKCSSVCAQRLGNPERMLLVQSRGVLFVQSLGGAVWLR